MACTISSFFRKGDRSLLRGSRARGRSRKGAMLAIAMLDFGYRLFDG